jgi:Flp pilus assembly protein TadD
VIPFAETRPEKMTATFTLEPLESLHFLKGEIFARMSRREEAEREFLAELKPFPYSADAQASLALLYAAWGRKADARRVLKEFLAGNPGPNILATAAQVSTILGDTAQPEEYRRRAKQKASSAPHPRRGSSATQE